MPLFGSEANGVIVIEASRFRTQQQNRADARERLFEMIRKASVAPKRRRPTRPGRAAREKRLRAKKRRGAIKALRGAAGDRDQG